MTCKAIRQSDEMFCAACGLRWDMDDMFPPVCGRRDRLLIGIAGRAGSGKSTMARLIRNNLGQSNTIKFARPLKTATRALLVDVGYSSDEAERAIEGDLKNTVDPRLGGYSPRDVMKAIGNGVRTELDDAFWVELWRARAQMTTCHVIVDDVRYPNEADAIRNLGGRVVMITGRHDPHVSADHVSEQFGFEPDMPFHNVGSIHDMQRWVSNHVTSASSYTDWRTRSSDRAAAGRAPASRAADHGCERNPQS